MNTSRDARQEAENGPAEGGQGAENVPAEGAQDTESVPAKGGRLRSLSVIVIFDIGAPLATYYLLRSAGLSAVAALLISGVFPALGVAIGVVRNRRLDAVGVLVLAGIVAGTVLGLISHSARLILVEGSVPTAVFGAACLGSLLRGRRPLIFTFALEFVGPDTAQGREMTQLWEYEGYRRVFRVITLVWGCGFLLEAALRVLIVYSTSPGTALTFSKITPFVFAGVFTAWTIGYGNYQKRKGQRMAAAAGVTLPGRRQ